MEPSDFDPTLPRDELLTGAARIMFSLWDQVLFRLGMLDFRGAWRKALELVEFLIMSRMILKLKEIDDE